MEPIEQNGPTSIEDTVHGSREPRTDRFHPAREIPRRRRLDDRMDMVSLDRVVDDTETPALASSPQRSLERAHEATTPQRGNAASHSQRDVTRMRAFMRCAKAMRIARTRAALSSGAFAAAAPRRRRSQIEGELLRSSRHDSECRIMV
jgi:hypothetical protein